MFVVLLGACGTSRQPATGTGEGPAADADTAAAPRSEEERREAEILNANRSSLRDLHVTQLNDLPEKLTQEHVTREGRVDSTAGFRIQILSTRNVALADSVAGRFRVWADSTISGYQADTYQFFQQPFYKVHVGDFLDRRRAIEYSRLVQRRFPDAWVVHDRIEPRRVPADTVRFEFQEKPLRR